MLAWPSRAASARRRHVILMIADGWGFQQVAATRSYTGRAASYEAFERLAMATWDLDVAARNGTPGYDPSRAWTNLGYVLGAATDSAASATAMFTGIKTRVGRIGVGRVGSSARSRGPPFQTPPRRP